MKNIVQGVASYRTADDVADAVLRLHLVLVRRQRVEVVEVPFVDEEGAVRRVGMTVGYTTGTTTVSEAERDGDLLDVQTIVDLYDRAETAPTAHATAFSEDERRTLQWPELE